MFERARCYAVKRGTRRFIRTRHITLICIYHSLLTLYAIKHRICRAASFCSVRVFVKSGVYQVRYLLELVRNCEDVRCRRGLVRITTCRNIHAANTLAHSSYCQCLPDLELGGSATPRIGLAPASHIPARSHIPSTEFSPLLVYHPFSLISHPFSFMHSSLFSGSPLYLTRPLHFPLISV